MVWIALKQQNSLAGASGCVSPLRAQQFAAGIPADTGNVISAWLDILPLSKKWGVHENRFNSRLEVTGEEHKPTCVCPRRR